LSSSDRSIKDTSRADQLAGDSALTKSVLNELHLHYPKKGGESVKSDDKQLVLQAKPYTGAYRQLTGIERY
jgi:hypothetical protein